MYLSILKVNMGHDPNKSRPGRTWVKNVHHVHQRLWMAFDRLPQRKAPFLFRIIPGAQTRIMVQSLERPDWDLAFRNAPFLLEDYPQEMVPVSGPLVLAYTVGQRMKFSLLANPTQIRHFDDRRNGQRVGIFGQAALRSWLDKKGAQHGFSVVTAEIDPQGKIQCRKKDPPKGNVRELVFDAVRFDGILEVSSSEDFCKAASHGIGSGKAYGFGLLATAPIETRTCE